MADDVKPDGDASQRRADEGCHRSTSGVDAEQEEDVLGAAPTEPAAKKRRLRLPRKRRAVEEAAPPAAEAQGVVIARA